MTAAVSSFAPLTPRDRARALGAVVMVHVALLAALIATGRVSLQPVSEPPPLQTIDVALPAVPPPPVRQQPRPSPKPAAAEASAPNIVSQATPVAAPKPVIVLPAPAPVVVSETPMMGADPTQGAAPVAGPGTGAGGAGDGTGAGGAGNGSGTGTGGGIAMGPRQIAGFIGRRDYPRELEGRDVPYEEVMLQYRVGIDGFVRDCRVVRSSGEPLLDQRTCALYEQRYRYLPARDTSGRPVEITIGAVRSWALRR